jgi:hypothetical protein
LVQTLAEWGTIFQASKHILYHGLLQGLPMIDNVSGAWRHPSPKKREICDDIVVASTLMIVAFLDDMCNIIHELSCYIVVSFCC